MWISRKRLEEIKKASYTAGLDKGYELGSQPGSRRLNRLAHMGAVEEAERMLRNGK